MKKEKILEHFNYLIGSYDKAELLGIYLKKIIDEVDIDNDVDLIELEFDVQKIVTYGEEKFSDHLPIGIVCNML